jgi:hypothetical protein
MKKFIYCLLLLLIVCNARKVIIIGDGGSSGTRLNFYSEECKDSEGKNIPAP